VRARMFLVAAMNALALESADCWAADFACFNARADWNALSAARAAARSASIVVWVF
jgi:hypothetical protein